jgi:HEPN domain-containing protein
MLPEASEEAGRWLTQAQDDLMTATRLRDIAIHYAACFFAQQAAEKALKAVLFARGAARIRGHSVADLCGEAARFDTRFGPMASSLAPLDLYYIPTRYPNGLPGGVPSAVFKEEDSERAIRLAHLAVETSRDVVVPHALEPQEP